MKEILGFFALMIVLAMAAAGLRKLAAVIGTLAVVVAVIGGLFG